MENSFLLATTKLIQRLRNGRQSSWCHEESQPQGEGDITAHRKKQKETSTFITLLVTWNKPKLRSIFLDIAIKSAKMFFIVEALTT